MTTKSILTPTRSVQIKAGIPRQSRLPRRIVIGLLMLLGVVLTLMFALPVPLLYVVTSVPPLISLGLVIADIGIIIAFFHFERTPTTMVAAFGGIVLVSILAVWLSQVFASIPPITDADGNPVAGSIAVMETVNLNGSDQWITIRGYDVNNPVLLFLAGGPGGSELVMIRKHLPELEKHFVVVNWDQPGTGKSYNAVAINDLTPERFVSDGYALTQLLRERFQQDKIYLLGESWGSILGIWLVQQYPDLYHAFTSTGQMVNTTEDDVMGYEFALDYLTQQGKTEEAERLRRDGPPPYNSIWSYSAYLGVLNDYMFSNAHGEGLPHDLILDSMPAPEYGLADKVNWARGLIDAFNQVYPQIADLDFMTQANQLNVPVYFIVGRWDVNAMTSLVEEYFGVLEAPHKELIWFEDSAHVPLWEEPTHFTDVMINTVLAQTQPG